jgi:RNAse (barnase) inhibitor barstar
MSDPSDGAGSADRAAGVEALAGLGPGVRPVSEPVDLGALGDACGRQGRPFVVLDTHAVADKAAFMEAVSTAFELPGWFGRNWDALAECLGDVPPGTVLAWDGWTDLARAAPRACEVAIEVLAESGLTVLMVNAPQAEE